MRYISTRYTVRNVAVQVNLTRQAKLASLASAALQLAAHGKG